MLTSEQQAIQNRVLGYTAAGAKFLADRLLVTIFSGLEDDAAVAVHNAFAAELRSMIELDDFDGFLEDVGSVVIKWSRIFRDGPE